MGARAFGRRARALEREQARKRVRPSRRPTRASLREVLRRVPRAAWLCAAVACLNAVCWSIITPPFQVPDEPEHVAYVKQLAETGHLPSHNGQFSSEEAIALQDLRLQTVAEEPEYQPIASKAQQEKLQQDLTAAARFPKKAANTPASPRRSRRSTMPSSRSRTRWAPAARCSTASS